MRYATVNFSDQIHGDTFLIKEVNFFESDQTPLDLSDVTPVVEIRKGSRGGKLVKTATVGDGISWRSQGQGRLSFGNFPISWGGPDVYYYDLKFTYATSGIERTYLVGKIEVEQGETPTDSTSNNTINVTVDEVNEVINLTISDAVITQGGGGTFIDSFLVVKGAGNTGTTIEVGDKITGFIGSVWVAGEVTNTPVNDVSDVKAAVQGEYL